MTVDNNGSARDAMAIFSHSLLDSRIGILVATDSKIRGFY